jgi:hypothetical protein
MGDIYTGADKLEAYLEHHGILGMHWGIRRYQNKDGSLTAKGISRLERNKRRNRLSAALEYSKQDVANEKHSTFRDVNNKSYKIAKGIAAGRRIVDPDNTEFSSGRKLKKQAKKYVKQYEKALSKDTKELVKTLKQHNDSVSGHVSRDKAATETYNNMRALYTFGTKKQRKETGKYLKAYNKIYEKGYYTHLEKLRRDDENFKKTDPKGYENERRHLAKTLAPKVNKVLSDRSEDNEDHFKDTKEHRDWLATYQIITRNTSMSGHGKDTKNDIFNSNFTNAQLKLINKGVEFEEKTDWLKIKTGGTNHG